MYSMEWSLGAEFWSGVEKILEWQKYLFFAHKTVYSIIWSGVLERSFGLENRSGEESNFGVAKELALCS